MLNFSSGVRDLLRQPEFAPYRNSYWLVVTPFDRDPASSWRDKKMLLVRKDRPNLAELERVFDAELVEVSAPAVGSR